MSTARWRDVHADLVALLRDQIDVTGVEATVDPSTDIDHPDYESGLSFPGIYPNTETGTLPGGGTTGYFAEAGDGSGPVQRPRIAVQIDCWGGTEETAAINAGSHPETVAEQLGEAVWDVLQDNAQATHTAVSGYQLIGMDGPPFRAHDTDASPTVYRYIVPAVLFYERR